MITSSVASPLINNGALIIIGNELSLMSAVELQPEQTIK